MKYFTLEWYKAEYPENDTDPGASREWPDAVQLGYARHLQEMQGVLSADVLKLALLPGVDDALIALVRHNKQSQTLALTLRAGDARVGYYDLALRYDGARISPEHERTLALIARTTGRDGRFGPDVLRHELDRTDDAKIEHRFLFHGGYWFTVQCNSLRWARLPRPNRRLPRRFDRFPGGPVSPSELNTA